MQISKMLIEKDFTIKDVIKDQHPVINTWLALSSLSICFLSALFFIFP